MYVHLNSNQYPEDTVLIYRLGSKYIPVICVNKPYSCMIVSL